MEEQIKQQFEKFQSGLTSALETNAELLSYAARSNEVVLDSLEQLTKDQIAFGRSCRDIGQRQLETLTKDNDVSALFTDQSVRSDSYDAVTKYGEAVRKNAENAYKRFTSLGREATETVSATVSA